MEIILKKTDNAKIIEILKFSLIGLLIGYMALSFSTIIALGIIIAVILGWVGYEFPEKALLVLAALIPFHLEWEVEQLFGMMLGPVAIIVISVLIGNFIKAVIKKNLQMFKVPYFLFWIIYGILSCAAFLHSPYFISDITRIPWHLYRVIWRALLIYPLIVINFKDKKTIKQAIIILFMSTTIVSLFGIFQSLSGKPLHIFIFGITKQTLKYRSIFSTVPGNANMIRAYGSFVHSNAFASFLTFILSLSSALFFTDRAGKMKKLYGTISIITFLALILTFSRGGLVAFLVSFILISFLCKKRKLMVYAITFGFIMLIIFPALLPDFMINRMKSISNPSQVEEMVFRTERWESFLEIILKNPLLGRGYSTLELGPGKIAQTAHNLYLHISVMQGIPALVVLLIFIFSNSIKLLTTVLKTDDTFIRGLTLGILGGLISLLVHGIVDALLGIEQISITFWFLAGLGTASVMIDRNKGYRIAGFINYK